MSDKTIQYVGARYVPKFAEPLEWTANKSYESLTIVSYNNDSYTSKQPVPATVGNPAENPSYWVLTGNYNSQVEEYRKDVISYKTETADQITALARGISVKNYGAKGDGTTDDTNAILSMVNDFGYAIIPSGTFLCNLSFKTPVSLYGVNWKTSILKAYDSTKNVVEFLSGSEYSCASNLRLTGGKNGLYIEKGCGNVIYKCYLDKNTDNGLYISGKSDLNEKLITIDSCYSSLNGLSGYNIENFPDWCMVNSEGASNASESGKEGTANLIVNGGAGKVTNSHFWNFAEWRGYGRPYSSVLINNTSCIFEGCHIEGGHTNNIKLTGDDVSITAVGCVIYACFGEYVVDTGNAYRALFSGCDLRGSASDKEAVGVKSFFNPSSTSSGSVYGCNAQVKLFSTTRSCDNWLVDVRANVDDVGLKEIADSQYCSARISGAGGVNDGRWVAWQGSGEITQENNNVIVATGDITITNPIPRKELVVVNATTSTITITLPRATYGGENTATLESGKAVIIYFTPHYSIVI